MNDFPDRRRVLTERLAEYEVDGFLTVDPAHVAWLTGFSGSNAGAIIASNGQSAISTDGRYTVQAGKQAPDVPLVSARNTGAALLERAPQMGVTRLGIESDLLTLAAYEDLKSKSSAAVELVATEGFVGKQRVVKSEGELTALREVALIAVRAFEDMLAAEVVVPGRTERQVAAELEYRMRMHGADRPSFDTIVASGPNSAKPHHGAEDRIIEAGDLVTIDFGAYSGGYNSDMTRTLFAGGAQAAPAKAREIYNVVLESQLAGIDAAVAGASLVDVDGVCRKVISDAGYGEYFVHSTGHGIGIEVHELPFAAQTGKGHLAEGMTLTIEPGIYIPGFGGVRIEDTLVITSEAPEIITPLPKPSA